MPQLGAFGGRLVVAGDDALERHAAGGVGLRVEEHLDVADAVGGGALEVGAGEVVEVAARSRSTSIAG